MNLTRMKTNVEDILNFLFTKENYIFLKVDHMVEISIKNSPKIDVLKVKTFKEPDYKTQQENQIKFQSSKSELQKGNFCYVDFDEKLFDKSFDVVVSLKEIRNFY